MDDQLEASLRDSFVWFPEHGYGYYPVKSGIEPYGKKYWEEYVARGQTRIGRRLNDFRVALVDKYVGDHPVLDVGIGAGTFVERRGGNTFGYDVNPIGVKWLKDRGRWIDWREKGGIANVTTWDVLEHILEPRELLDKVTNKLFVSIPIFRNVDHVMQSKHYKPAEHCWYFTESGFAVWMARRGFKVLEVNAGERRIGREDVLTFVFEREQWPKSSPR